MGNLIGIAISHQWIPTTIFLRTLDLVAVLIVLQTPGNGVIGTGIFVCRTDDSGGRCGACCGADLEIRGDGEAEGSNFLKVTGGKVRLNSAVQKCPGKCLR